MSKLQLPKAWRTIAIIAVISIVLSVVIGLIVMPRINTWAKKQLPAVFAVQEALKAQYPDKKIAIMDRTTYGSGSNADGKERVLEVSIIGSSHLNSDEAKEAKRTICAALGKHSQSYDKVAMQNIVEKRLLIFYSRQNVPDTFTCPIN